MQFNSCPHCDGDLRIAAKTCSSCGLELRGAFLENPLTNLTRAEQDFLLEFILCAGNFKALGERVDLSYPTLRARLDKIITRLQEMIANQRPDEVLDAVERGALTPEVAIKQLKGMISKHEETA